MVMNCVNGFVRTVRESIDDKGRREKKRKNVGERNVSREIKLKLAIYKNEREKNCLFL